MVADESLGAYAIAGKLGTETKNITGPLKEMEESGTLVTEPGEGQVRQLYRLADGLETALEEAVATANEPGKLQQNQPLLLVRSPHIYKVLELIRPRDVAGALAWTTRVGDRGILLAFAAGTESALLDQLMKRCVDGGASVERLTVGEIATARDFLVQTRALRGAGRTAK